MAKRLFVITEYHKTIIQEPKVIGVFDNDNRASGITEALNLRYPDFEYNLNIVELNKLMIELKESKLMKFLDIWTSLRND